MEYLRIKSADSSLRFLESFLLSLRRNFSVSVMVSSLKREGGKMTAPAKTGPQEQPLPASSMPIMNL